MSKPAREFEVDVTVFVKAEGIRKAAEEVEYALERAGLRYELLPECVNEVES